MRYCIIKGYTNLRMFNVLRQLMQIRQGFVTYILWPITTCIIYCPLIIIFLLLKSYKSVGWLIQQWGESIFILLGQSYEIEGLENIDKNKRYILIANHGSMYDISLCTLILNQQPISWVLKESLLKIPVAGTAFRLGLGIPISRANARDSQKKIMDKIKALREHINPHIIMYPEGTRTKDGEIHAFKRGFIQVMKEYEMDILPVTLSGVYTFFSTKQKFTEPSANLKITIHPPQSYQELNTMTDKEILEKVQTMIKKDYYA